MLREVHVGGGPAWACGAARAIRTAGPDLEAGGGMPQPDSESRAAEGVAGLEGGEEAARESDAGCTPRGSGLIQRGGALRPMESLDQVSLMCGAAPPLAVRAEFFFQFSRAFYSASRLLSVFHRLGLVLSYV